MSKAVLISIQPKWVEKIANGEKTIEVRKSVPKLERPFKVYIYATWNGNNKEILVKQDGLLFCEDWRKASGLQRASGKVIGEFVCDRIDSYVGRDDNKDYWDLSVEEWEELKKKSCLTIPQILDYTGDCCRCYGWHISELKIYDKPKELGEFFTPMGKRPSYMIERPPQSWCYVEELQNG